MLNTDFETNEKKSFKSFTFDFKALYDSLNPDIVLEAVNAAMIECRPNWTVDFRSWILSLISMSLKSSVGLFENLWYKQKQGVPTGGSLCVQVANITVYYIMHKIVYSKPVIMKDIKAVKRYIDDGAGTFGGSKRQFNNWMDTVNRGLSSFGLHIDEFVIKDTSEYVNFLDIQFCFDHDGQLQTDLYIKETDSRSYLNFSSSHPNHTYSGIVYSQCQRLRRIINDDERLASRLEELKVSFIKAGYPRKMVDNICSKVKSTKRSLECNPKNKGPKNKGPKNNPSSPNIRIISTYGSDKSIIDTVKKFEPLLKRTRSFSGSDNSVASASHGSTSTSRSSHQPTEKSLFQFVKKTGSSIKNRLVKVKSQALGNRFGPTLPCNERNCMCCRLVSHEESRIVNGRVVKSAPGTCSTYNIIYLVSCKMCSKCYVGRSTRTLKTRIGEHRRGFYHILSGKTYDENDDAFSIGMHLLEHGCSDKSNFNECISVCIIDNCNPKSLEVKEHKFIHSFQTLRPMGLNTQNPFSLSILNPNFDL